LLEWESERTGQTWSTREDWRGNRTHISFVLKRKLRRDEHTSGWGRMTCRKTLFSDISLLRNIIIIKVSVVHAFFLYVCVRVYVRVDAMTVAKTKGRRERSRCSCKSYHNRRFPTNNLFLPTTTATTTIMNMCSGGTRNNKSILIVFEAFRIRYTHSRNLAGRRSHVFSN